ncbi:uncharacterized protein MYCFIDRAFT_177553 [Pseudocercospora fijiensis CIRAD86]|uniref:Uncharacterized protein n=1 Tax=Pseudocercospora fijiensis (strain CIRAD86) TaxID=383855 RepID=M3ATZ4_PSEFD|nr:uncharacterized protein MYCFIDRAFT_177553 [Pseudocercospora fijiensis CIRAD86]EME80623.1 hypothetical protein MYCFIDRAFT_177553 [Pseudocercospora fijiensis CIRAD86]
MSFFDEDRVMERLDPLQANLEVLREELRQDLRIANGTHTGMPQPPARRSHRGTPDLFANTSLDESLNALPAAPPRLVPHRQDREAAQRQRNDEFHVRQFRRQLARNEQQAADAKIKADRRADRLNAHRRQEADVHAAVARAFENWKTDSPATFERFRTHQVHALYAATSAVRVTDILLWFGDMPADATKALEDLAKYLHVEAVLQTDLNSAERAEAFGEGEGAPFLNPEIAHASKMTSVNKRGEEATYQSHSIYGMGKDHASLSKLALDFTGEGEEKTRVLRIEGAFNIRKTLLETAPLDSRFPKVSLSKSIDGRIMDWCRAAFSSLTSIREGAHATNLPTDVKKRCISLQNHIMTLIGHLEKRISAYNQMTELISTHLLQKSKTWKETTDAAEKASLYGEISEIVTKLEQCEEEYGDILPLWRIYVPWIENGEEKDEGGD